MNFARFNHILIPQSGEQRLRWLYSKKGAFLLWPMRVYMSLTSFGRFLLIFWMFAWAMSLNMGETVCYVVWGAITGLFAASFSIRSFFKLSDVQLTVSNGRRVVVDDEIEFTIRVQNTGERIYQALELEGPFLTWDGVYVGYCPHIQTLGPHKSDHVRVKAIFKARGKHDLMPFTARQVVPLGLVTGSVVSSNLANFLVVPKFPPISHMDIPLSVKYQPGGVALASRIGEARELVGVRPYRAGDRLRDIHPQTWAKTGVPHVKEYNQEFFSRVGVVIDTDTKNNKIDENVFEAAISLGAGCVAYMSRGEALIDLLVVDNRVHQLTLGRSLGFLEQALDLLACAKPGNPIDIAVLEPQLSPLLQKLSCVVFISLDFTDTHSEFVQWVHERGVACKAYEIVSGELQAREQLGITRISVEDVNGSEGLVL